MAFQKSLWFLLAFFMAFISASHAYTFQVGGKDGWTLHPSESYSNWAGRLRFLINDTLHFKYDGGSDSVLVVNKGDYDGCNTNNPITKLDGGDSMFKFDRSGPFYFITGNKSNCDQGQKLIVVVLALRNRSPPPSVATPPSPSTLPPFPAVSPVPPPSPFTLSPVSPPSSAESPTSPPSGTPVSTPPASSPGGGSASSPGGGSASPPSGTPVLTPPASSPGGGSGSSPGGGSASSPGGGGASSPGGGGGQSPGGNNPSADVNTPPSPSAATPLLSGPIIASLVTMVFALWGLN